MSLNEDDLEAEGDGDSDGGHVVPVPHSFSIYFHI